MKRNSLNTIKGKNLLYAFIIILFLISLACPARTVEPALATKNIETPSEYELKAIYLYNFLQFVQWPIDTCPAEKGHSLEIGVLGKSTLQPVLKALQEKLLTQNQELNLRFYGPYQEGMELSECCLLFISNSESVNLDRILDHLKDKPVLTVTDEHNFAEKGVMITLLSQNNKVRWTVNRKPVKQAGLRLSAKLLDIAVEVID